METDAGTAPSAGQPLVDLGVPEVTFRNARVDVPSYRTLDSVSVVVEDAEVAVEEEEEVGAGACGCGGGSHTGSSGRGRCSCGCGGHAASRRGCECGGGVSGSHGGVVGAGASGGGFGYPAPHDRKYFSRYIEESYGHYRDHSWADRAGAPTFDGRTRFTSPRYFTQLMDAQGGHYTSQRGWEGGSAGSASTSTPVTWAAAGTGTAGWGGPEGGHATVADTRPAPPPAPAPAPAPAPPSGRGFASSAAATGATARGTGYRGSGAAAAPPAPGPAAPSTGEALPHSCCGGPTVVRSHRKLQLLKNRHAIQLQ